MQNPLSHLKVKLFADGADKKSMLELYANPLHPYTAGLFASVPRLTGEGFADGIPGRLPDYLRPPAGCRFQPRCPHAMPRCAAEKPQLGRASDGHSVACFLFDGGADG